jgi:hypothetical protein
MPTDDSGMGVKQAEPSKRKLLGALDTWLPRSVILIVTASLLVTEIVTLIERQFLLVISAMTFKIVIAIIGALAGFVIVLKSDLLTRGK